MHVLCFVCTPYSMHIAYSHLPEYALQYLSRILCVTFYLCRCLSCHNAEKKWDKSNEDASLCCNIFHSLSLRYRGQMLCMGLILILIFSVSLRIFRFNSHGVLRRLIVRKTEIEICTIWTFMEPPLHQFTYMHSAHIHTKLNSFILVVLQRILQFIKIKQSTHTVFTQFFFTFWFAHFRRILWFFFKQENTFIFTCIKFWEFLRI